MNNGACKKIMSKPKKNKPATIQREWLALSQSIPCVGKAPLKEYQLRTIIRVVEHKGDNKACTTRMKDNGPPSFLQHNKSKSCQEQWH